MGDSDPKTPEGVVVGTPRLEIDGTVSDDLANIHAMDCSQILSVDGMNLGTSTMSQSADRDPLASQIELPDLSYSEFSFQGNEEHTATPSSLGDATLEHRLPLPTSSSTPTSTHMSTHIQYDVDFVSEVIGEETRLTLLWQNRSRSGHNPDDLISALEPIGIRDVFSDLRRRAEALFQSPSPENLSRHLSLCVYLSSNNLMDQRSTDHLLLFIKKSRSQSLLGALFKSTATTIEISMSNLLASAAAVGDIEICRILIEAGADLDAPHSGPGMRARALQRALEDNNVECARMLLEAGADPNAAVNGVTALHIACSKFNALDIVLLLLHFGAHVNPPQDCARLTPLQLAVRSYKPDLVQLLLENKANPNSFTTFNPINAKIVKLLIAAGAVIDSRASYRCDNRHSDYLGDSDADSESEQEPDEGCFLGYSGLPDSFKPAILLAAENENWEVVQLLLEKGAAVNASLRKCPPTVLEQELDKNSWRSEKAVAVFTPLQAAVRAQNIAMIRMLLSAGAHIDGRPKGKYGHTALQICAMAGNERIIEILLREGADVNAPAGVYRGRTALQAAAIHSDTTVLSTLLRAGADANAPPAEWKGKTALQVAVAAGNTEGVRILLDANAAVNTDPMLTGGVTALQEAIRIGDWAIRNEIVYLLVRAGAYTEGLKYQRESASLHIAVRNGNLEMRKLLEKDVVGNKSSPLQEVSSRGNEDLVQVLIDHEADVNGPPAIEQVLDSIEAAAGNGRLDTLHLLLNYHPDTEEFEIRKKKAYRKHT